jgi:hypothetical protein
VSKALRLLGAVALATATVPFYAVGPASAASSLSLPASAQGYFNASAVDKPEQSPAAPPVNATVADGVDAGNLAVAAKGGTEDKVSALLFDLSALEPGTVVTKAVLTLQLAEGGTNVNASPAPEKVRACAAGPEGFGGDDGAAIALAPARLCDVFAAPAKASADAKSYVIDITKLAATWIDGINDGITLTAADGAATTNFQVVFQPGTAADLALEYTPAPETATPPVVDVPDAGTSGTPDLGGVSGGVTPAPPADTGGYGSTTTPTVPEVPAPTAGVAPAPPVAAPAVAAPVKAVSLEVLRPTTAFWVGGILLAAVLVLLSLIMGDANVPAASTRPTRLAKALTDRQRGTSALRPAFGRPLTV